MPLGILLLSAAALQQLDQPKQWVCTSFVQGRRGASMDVQFYVQADGTVVGQGVLWTPPAKSRSIARPALSNLGLTIAFGNASQSALGAPTNAEASVLGSNVDALDKATAKLVVEGAVPAEAAFGARDTSETGPHYRGGDFGSGEAPAVAALGREAREAKLLVAGETNQKLVSIVYDLTQVGERNHLFRLAWARAKSKLRRPAQCSRTSREGGLNISIPVP